MAERTIPFREDESKVLVSAITRHEGPRSVEPEWSGDRGTDYGEELWFDLKHGSFLERQTHKVLRYDIDTGEDTSWYYPDKVNEFSILDLLSTGFDIDSIDDGTPWFIAGPIADYLRNPTPLQAIESLTAIYRSKIGMDYWNDYANWKKPDSLVSDSICILPDHCSSQLAEQILTDFANSPDDGLTTDEAGVTQALSKLDFPTGEITGETRSVIRSFQETLERLYDRESGRTLNWYHPASGRLVTRTFNDAFELYDTPIPYLTEGASVSPDLKLGTWLQIDGSHNKDVTVRSVAKSIATEDGWISVDGDRTVGDLAEMVAEAAQIGEDGLDALEASVRAVAGGRPTRSADHGRDVAR